MATNLVITKSFRKTPVTVRVADGDLSISVPLTDFITQLAALSMADLAADVAKNAGNPALLLTNAQLVRKMQESVSRIDVASTLAKHSEALLFEMRMASSMAQ
jgi:hypothetical protein